MALGVAVSIPSTDSDFDENGAKYTIYNIYFQTQNKKFKIKRRYSEFLELHEALTEQFPNEAFEPFPAKSWFYSLDKTVVETRRIMLENFVCGLVAKPHLFKNRLVQNFLHVKSYEYL
eukprot:TRINITY_DN2731_c0_g1_i2.p1 TRINITY_DN2731_c0_g1~~TRINITY_DN2731_c0_g1_i2.p1  ORF type:complete len:118 (-),score=20.11 TRINITY_DN2731_c0_g1_i2:323-676(-)